MITVLKKIGARVRKLAGRVVNLVRGVLRLGLAAVVLAYLLPLLITGAVLYGLPTTLSIVSDMVEEFQSSPCKWPSRNTSVEEIA